MPIATGPWWGAMCDSVDQCIRWPETFIRGWANSLTVGNGRNPPHFDSTSRHPNKLTKMYLLLGLKVVVLDYNCDGL